MKHFRIYESDIAKLPPKRGNVVEQIKKLEERRERRRQLMVQKKERMEEAKLRNVKAGRNVDLEYDEMIREDWLSQEIATEHVQS